MDVSSVSSGSNQIGSILSRQEASDQKATVGLQDRNRISERVSLLQETNKRVTQNSGFDSREALVNALANNTKINNIPVDERGSYIDISA